MTYLKRTKYFKKKSEDSNIEAGIIESNNNLVLGKEKLVNEMCRNFFSNLLFGKKTQQIDKKDFDFYCSKYLLTMFKHTTIEEFNMNLFLESLSKILPPPTMKQSRKGGFQIRSIIWKSMMLPHTLETWIPGTPNYKKTKNNHKALI